MTKHVDMSLAGEAETLYLGSQIAKVAPGGSVVFLHGQLGAGKTTLVRGFLQELGHNGAVKSPTYTLVEHYAFHNHHIYHFDLYRLGDGEELEYMGIRDYFGPRNICLIEWAEKGAGYLPQADLDIRLHYEEAGHRRVEIEASSKNGYRMLQHLVELFGPQHASWIKVR